tara:strand:+ start:11690 stop:12298 length:609 start_codon:yes stop_codon:yes gene_type:complete
MNKEFKELEQNLIKIEQMKLSDSDKENLKKKQLEIYDISFKANKEKSLNKERLFESLLPILEMGMILSRTEENELFSDGIIRYYSYTQKLNRFFLYNCSLIESYLKDADIKSRCELNYENLRVIHQDILKVTSEEKIELELVRDFFHVLVRVSALFFSIIKEKELAEKLFGIDYEYVEQIKTEDLLSEEENQKDKKRIYNFN